MVNGAAGGRACVRIRATWHLRNVADGRRCLRCTRVVVTIEAGSLQPQAAQNPAVLNRALSVFFIGRAGADLGGKFRSG